jgi:glycosyltransferase involved in cell wall biosynthesis
MRVLIVHNHYRQPGGEDTAVANEKALLDAQGWDTRLWAVTNDEVTGAWRTVVTALRTPYSRPARRRMARAIADYAPDLVHIHNFFPLLSPSLYDACRAARVAVVQTLHNYRTICAGAMLERDGRPCEDCIGASPYRAALYGCYRGSHLGSLAVASMIDLHRRRGTWLDRVDRFIALSHFSKSRFVAAGFPSDRIAVKPNFAPDRPAGREAPRAGALFVGRLSAEKGIAVLLRAWVGLDVPLRIVGDGPLRGLVDEARTPTIEALGRLAQSEVGAAMTQAAFLVLPSLVYENFPLVVAEAFCRSLPVIAARIGALAEIVEDQTSGLLFSPGDSADLEEKVLWAHRHPEAMRAIGANARRVYERRYSPQANFSQLTKIYRDAIEQRRTAASTRRRTGEM